MGSHAVGNVVPVLVIGVPIKSNLAGTVLSFPILKIAATNIKTLASVLLANQLSLLGVHMDRSKIKSNCIKMENGLSWIIFQLGPGYQTMELCRQQRLLSISLEDTMVQVRLQQ